MTLWRYILRGFARALLAVFAVIALVIILFTVVENLRRYGEGGAQVADIVGSRSSRRRKSSTRSFRSS